MNALLLKMRRIRKNLKKILNFFILYLNLLYIESANTQATRCLIDIPIS